MRYIACALAVAFAATSSVAVAQSHYQGQKNQQQVSQNEVHWHIDFDEAHRLSRRTGKPLLVLFTGSDWCTWCKKLEREVFEARDFKSAMGDKVIFVKLDFPMRNKQSQAMQRRNKRLQKQFQIEGFPTVLALDPQLNQIAVLGYRRGGGKRYAEYVLNLLKEHDALAWQMKSLNAGVFDADELEEMYADAKESGHDDYLAAIMGAGLKCDENSFFLCEKYRELCEADQGNSAEAKEIRAKLLATENKDRQNCSYRVAVIDFQALSDEHKDDKDPSTVLAPLLGYLDEFGETNAQNIWKVHMMVSQVFSSKEDWAQALKHAEKSLAKAPEALKADVEASIEFLKSKLS